MFLEPNLKILNIYSPGLSGMAYFSTKITELMHIETLSQWGQWDLNPRPPAPQANTSMTCTEQKCYHIKRDGILDQARRWPLTN